MGKIKPVLDPTRVEEYRSGRNFIRKGDLVRITPPEGSPPGTHGYPARFQYAAEDKGGQYACVLQLEKTEKGILVGCGFRFITPDRMERKATTHDPARAVQERAAARKQRGGTS
jgi:hypothetical protein